MQREQYLAHEVNAQVDALRSAFSAVKSRASGVGLGLFDEEKQIELLVQILADSDPAFIWADELNEVASLVGVTISALARLKAGLDEPTTTTPSNEILIAKDEFAAAFRNIFRTLPASRRIERTNKEVQASIGNAEDYALTAITRMRREFETSTLASKELSDAGIVQLGELRKLIQAQQEILTKLRQEIANQNATLQADADKKAVAFDQLIEERRTALSTWSDGIENNGRDYLAKIEGLYKLSGDVTLSGRFFASAKSEDFSYFSSMLVSTVFFAAAIAGIAYETWYAHTSSLLPSASPLYLWLGKVSIVVVCIVPASIFANQAAKHRRAAIWYRVMGVRISTLQPYLSQVAGDYSIELKDIIKTFFISDPNMESGKDRFRLPNAKGISSIADELERLRKALLG